MAFPALLEAENKLEAKQKELKDIFDQAGPDIDLGKVKGFSSKDDVLAKMRELNAELDEIGKERDELREVERIASRAAEATSKGEPGHVETDGRPKDRRTMGQLIVASGIHRNKGQKANLDVNIKNTLFETSAGWAPQSLRSGLVVPDAVRPIQVTDLIPTVPTSQNAYKYMEETTFTNNAAETSEGGSYGEAALALTERSMPVEKVAVFIPVTDEQLEDEEGAMAYLDARLPFMVRQRLDGQIVNGNGSAPNLTGVLNASNLQTQAKGTDPVPDAVYKAMTKVRVTGRAIPGAAVFHPNDWQDVKLLRTADGIYIWGSPADAGPDRIWGIQVSLCDALTENTAVVGDFANYSLMAIRRGIEVQITNSHSDFFVSGKQAIRADMRVALIWTRGTAFCQVTGV